MEVISDCGEESKISPLDDRDIEYYTDRNLTIGEDVLTFSYTNEELLSLFEITDNSSSCEVDLELFSSTSDAPMNARTGAGYVELSEDDSLSVDGSGIATSE